MKTSQETVRNILQWSIETAFCGALAKCFSQLNRILCNSNRCLRNNCGLLLIVRRLFTHIAELLLIVRRQERRIAELLTRVRRKNAHIHELSLIVRRHERHLSELSQIVRRCVPQIHLYRLATGFVNMNLACLQDVLDLQFTLGDRI